MNYESHITIPAVNHQVAAEVAEKHNWFMSKITDDPLLGPGAKSYLTAHRTDYFEMWTDMTRVSAELARLGIPVLREKIELIMYDTKTKGKK